MLDQTLQDWRNYQQSKRKVKLAKMEEVKTFPCLVFVENNYAQAYLKIIENTTERCIHIISRKRGRGLAPSSFFKIPLANLGGYSKEHSEVILMLKEEVGEEHVEELEQGDAEEVKIEQIVLQFIDADTLKTAFAAVEEFEREIVNNLPTPKSTSSESEQSD